MDTSACVAFPAWQTGPAFQGSAIYSKKRTVVRFNPFSNCAVIFSGRPDEDRPVILISLPMA